MRYRFFDCLLGFDVRILETRSFQFVSRQSSTDKVCSNESEGRLCFSEISERNAKEKELLGLLDQKMEMIRQFESRGADSEKTITSLRKRAEDQMVALDFGGKRFWF